MQENELICPYCSHARFKGVSDQNGNAWLQCLGCDGRSKVANLVTRENYGR